jgi:hypothetical protein
MLFRFLWKAKTRVSDEFVTEEANELTSRSFEAAQEPENHIIPELRKELDLRKLRNGTDMLQDTHEVRVLEGQ